MLLNNVEHCVEVASADVSHSSPHWIRPSPSLTLTSQPTSPTSKLIWKNHHRQNSSQEQQGNICSAFFTSVSQPKMLFPPKSLFTSNSQIFANALWFCLPRILVELVHLKRLTIEWYWLSITQYYWVIVIYKSWYIGRMERRVERGAGDEEFAIFTLSCFGFEPFS